MTSTTDTIPRPSITTTRHGLEVRPPYREPLFTKRAHELHGAWNGTRWLFDPRDEALVRHACVQAFGSDGDDTGELATIRIELDQILSHPQTMVLPDRHTIGQIRWCGRVLATRERRDDAVVLGRGVRLIAGEFSGQCGTRRDPELGDLSGIRLEVRDIPQVRVDELADAERAGVVQLYQTVDRETLHAERDRLLQRLAAIERQLAD